MPREKEKIKFVVVAHYSVDKSFKDLLKSLIMREVTDTDINKNNKETHTNLEIKTAK